MKHLIYICILSATTAMLTLGACDKKDTIPDEPKETPPPVVIPPLDPDAPEPGGAIIADPPVLSGSFTHYPDNHYRIVQRSTENNAFTLLVVGDG